MTTIEYRLSAVGSTDATERAKRMARGEGYRIRTVASCRLAADVAPPKDPGRERGSWVVALVVRG